MHEHDSKEHSTPPLGIFIECDGSQIDCAICLQPCVHPTVLPCGHIFCYLCVKGLGRTTRMCAMCRREFPQDLIENPHLLRPVESTHDAGFEDGHQWFYEGRNGGWWQYECRISEEIENAYKTNERIVEIIICGELYVVDLNTMHQFQKNNSIRRRRIKRSRVDGMKAKGVAGLFKS
ncbi:hypothetical protein V9T40_007608 [Parthenolecanium corni]|uniref:E3 ubiquitin-protein ligase n=1 Tax=Parthenolecanium corni TaxID=536013 RepID=A0AAN9Y697_9HEMI